MSSSCQSRGHHRATHPAVKFATDGAVVTFVHSQPQRSSRREFVLYEMQENYVHALLNCIQMKSGEIIKDRIEISGKIEHGKNR
jgi:hypothetical protein